MNILQLRDITTRLCPYCPGLLAYETVGDLWRCTSCQVVRILDSKRGVEITQMDCYVGDKLYSVSLYHTEGASKIFAWNQRDAGSDVRFGDVVVEFDFVMDITPQNIKEKLKTILTFQ